MIELPSFETMAQLSINGALGGAMYGVAAVGLSLIFGTMRLIFLAQGAMIILAAYVVRFLFYKLGIDPFLSLPIMVAGGGGVGWLIYQGLFRRAWNLLGILDPPTYCARGYGQQLCAFGLS